MKNNKFSSDSELNTKIQEFFSHRALLISLTGLPGSGKSTIAQALMKRFQNWPIDVKLYDIDILRNHIFGEVFLPSNENSLREKYYEEIANSLRPNTLVIADDLNYFTSMRHRLYSLCKESNSKYLLIYVDTSLPVCNKRNESRDSPLDPQIIQRVARKFEIPGSKYRWDQPFYQYQTESLNVDEGVEEIWNRLLDYISSFRISWESQIEISENLNSLSDSIEKKTREIIHSIITRSVGENEHNILSNIDVLLLKRHNISRNDPTFAAKLNQLRRKFKNWLYLQLRNEPGEITLILFMEYLSTNFV